MLIAKKKFQKIFQVKSNPIMLVIGYRATEPTAFDTNNFESAFILTLKFD